MSLQHLRSWRSCRIKNRERKIRNKKKKKKKKTKSGGKNNIKNWGHINNWNPQCGNPENRIAFCELTVSRKEKLMGYYKKKRLDKKDWRTKYQILSIITKRFPVFYCRMYIIVDAQNIHCNRHRDLKNEAFICTNW